MSVDNVDVREEILDDRLQSWVLNLEFAGVFKEGKSWRCLKDFLSDIDDALNGDKLLRQRWKTAICLIARVTIDNSVDNAMTLHEKVDVHGWVNIF